MNVAKEMIHTVATVLGYKQTMLFLDECIADLYEIISTRISHKRALFDLEHSRCIEKHFGLAVLATEVRFIHSPPFELYFVTLSNSLILRSC